VLADLHHGPDHDEGPVRAYRGDLIEQFNVEALVDNAIEAQARLWQVFLIGGVKQLRAGLCEVRAVDRRWEAMDAWMAVLLGFEQAGPAGEDQVRLLDQLLLQVEKLRRREPELAEFVHRVENDCVGIDVP